VQPSGALRSGGATRVKSASPPATPGPEAVLMQGLMDGDKDSCKAVRGAGRTDGWLALLSSTDTGVLWLPAAD
jgi:hypothetical protein